MNKVIMEKIKSLMSERGLSKADLSRKTGISNSSLSEYFNEKYELKQDKLAIIAIALGVSPAWLMGFDNVLAPSLHETEEHYPAGKPSILLTERERDLIFKYRALDDTGRATVDAALDVLYKAKRAETPKKSKKDGCVS